MKKIFGEVIDREVEEIRRSRRFLERSSIAHNKYVSPITKKLKFSIANKKICSYLDVTNSKMSMAWCAKVAPRLSADSDLSRFAQKNKMIDF